MPTSGSYDYTITRDQIITSAFRKIGALGDFETLSTEKRNAGVAALNPLIKAMAALGMPLWTVTEQYIPFSQWATSSSRTIGPGGNINQPIKPLKIYKVMRRDNSIAGNPVDTEMNLYSYEEYAALSSKEQIGIPVVVFYQPQGYVGRLVVWPRPDTYWQTNGQLYIKYQRPVQDFDAAADEPDFPVEWHEVLIYQLAARLAPEYGLSPNDRMILKQEAKELLDRALEFDTEEGSLYIQPVKR